jgi:hypothetical protein
MISALHDSVLLRGVRSGEVALYTHFLIVALHTFIGAEVGEFLGGELPAIVSVQHVVCARLQPLLSP